MQTALCSLGLFLMMAVFSIGSVAAQLPEDHRISVRTAEVQLLPYPRIGKRFLITEPVVRRGGYPGELVAPTWRSTRSMKDALMDIYDMTESKRSTPIIAADDVLSGRMMFRNRFRGPVTPFGKRSLMARFG